MVDRPPVLGTTRVLTGGSLLAAGALALSFVLSVAGLDEAARLLSTTGIVLLLATPAVSLVVSALELRRDQPTASLLAIVVLLVLAAATLIAVFARP